MTYDSTSPPVRVFDIVTRERDPQRDRDSGPEAAAGAPAPHPVVVHPLALLGGPLPLLHVARSRRAPRRRCVLRRREGDR